MIEIIKDEGRFKLVRVTHCYRSDYNNYFVTSWLELRLKRRILPDITIKTTEDTYNNTLHLQGLLRRLQK